jgi:hypothetical protein
MALREKITGTTHATPGTTTQHAHSLGVTPDGVLVLAKVQGSVSCTAYGAANITVVGSAASMAFEAWVFVDHSIIK